MCDGISLIPMNFRNFEILWNFDIFLTSESDFNRNLTIVKMNAQSSPSGRTNYDSISKFTSRDIFISIILLKLLKFKDEKKTHKLETLDFPYLTPTPTFWNAKSQRRVLRTKVTYVQLEVSIIYFYCFILGWWFMDIE